MSRVAWYAAAGPFGAALALALLVGLTGEARAQDRERIRERCGATEQPEASCADVALASEALLGGVGLASSLGGELPGSPSTLGRRYGTSPRWAFAARVGAVQFDAPTLAGETPRASRDIWAPAFQGQVAAGVFDGFSLAPTVGGFLALDLLLTGGVTLLPGGEGFDGSAASWGYGARVGLLRESFSLPAVTFALARRHVGGFGYQDVPDPSVDVERLTVTSVRTTVGKEFVALGLLGGFGWDRARGDGTVRATASGPEIAFDDVTAGRFLIFGALTRTWLVLQATVEAGFATGYDERPGGQPTGALYDPTAGSFFGSLGLRLLY